jgi:ABC-type glycerol-3-phosphate transport system substrate-binding protein
MKKAAPLVLTSLLMVMVLILAACSGGGATPASSAAPSAGSSAASAASSAAEAATPADAPLPERLTMFWGKPQITNGPAWETEVGKKLKEITGTDLVIEYLVGQDIMQKANLMVAGGVYPDLIHAEDNVGIFIAGEAVIPLDELVAEYGENIKRIYRPKELELAALNNGKMYVLPTNRPSVDNLYPAAAYYLGYDVLKQNNFPVPKTINEYRDLLKSYVDANPEFNGQPTIGFTIATEGSRASALEYGAARFLSGYPNDGVTQVDQETLEAKIVMMQESTKSFLAFANDMWNTGYMDPETFMQKDDQFLAKISSGRVVGVYDQRWAIQEGLYALEAAGLDDRNLVGFPVVMEGVTKEYYRGPSAISAQGISISSSCEDPVGAIRFLDRLCADDVQKLFFWGIEGVDYSLTDGKFTRTEEQWNRSFDVEYRKTQGLEDQFNFLPHREKTQDETYGKFEDGNWVGTQFYPPYAELRYKPYEKQILSDYNIETLCDFFSPSYPAFYQPGWSVRQQMPQDSPEFIAVNKALETAREWNAKLIQASPADFDSMWDEYQALLLAIPGLTDYEVKATELIKASTQYYG